MKYSFIIALLCIAFSSCKKERNEYRLNSEKTIIQGTIDDYQRIYKTGKFTFFDAVTREIQNIIFDIDSLGNFSISFPLLHPIYGSASFELENAYYTDFYLIPGQTSRLTFSKNKLLFDENTSGINPEIAKFKTLFEAHFLQQNKKASMLYKENLPLNDYVKFQKNLQKEHLAFLKDYKNSHGLSKETYSILEEDIVYNTAHLIIAYRYDYSNGQLKERQIPDGFYQNLLQTYPIPNSHICKTKKCIDYINNLASALATYNTSIEDKISFFASFNFFSSEELSLLTDLYHQKKGILKTKLFQDFNTQRNRNLAQELSNRYEVNQLMKNLAEISHTENVDLLISQGVFKKLISKGFSVSDNEWKTLESSIKNPFIIKHLKSFEQREVDANTSKTSKINPHIKGIYEKYIKPFQGKVIYIDFYATWCAPCLLEKPYAKIVQREFQENDVVFLNLCAKSTEESWKKFISQKEITGESYLLNNEEFNLLSEHFKVKGFPTYILIDANGKVVNYEAPRPSNTEEIISAIKSLL